MELYDKNQKQRHFFNEKIDFVDTSPSEVDKIDYRLIRVRKSKK